MYNKIIFCFFINLRQVDLHLSQQKYRFSLDMSSVKESITYNFSFISSLLNYWEKAEKMNAFENVSEIDAKEINIFGSSR